MRRIRLIAAILSAVILTACTGYQTVADPEAGLEPSPLQLDQARITLWTGERFKLDSPQVFGDSVSGLQQDKSVRRLALADVKKFEMHTIHPERSMLLVEVAVCSIFSVIARGGACTAEDEEE
jgi:hypothetical protein